MQPCKLLALFVLVAPAASKVRVSKNRLDINQKVYIENQPVLGDGAGEGALNQCNALAPQFVANPDAPAVKVCGTGIKATFYLRGRCEEYYEHSKIVGTCDTRSPADDPRFGHYQSYKIEQC